MLVINICLIGNLVNNSNKFNNDFPSVLDFSLMTWMKEKSLDLNKRLAEGAVMLLLDNLNLTSFFQPTKCDRTRAPYSPSSQGIRNGIRLM